jgi:hypothetical protein
MTAAVILHGLGAAVLVEHGEVGKHVRDFLGDQAVLQRMRAVILRLLVAEGDGAKLCQYRRHIRHRLDVVFVAAGRVEGAKLPLESITTGLASLVPVTVPRMPAPARLKTVTRFRTICGTIVHSGWLGSPHEPATTVDPARRKRSPQMAL